MNQGDDDAFCGTWIKMGVGKFVRCLYGSSYLVVTYIHREEEEIVVGDVQRRLLVTCDWPLWSRERERKSEFLLAAASSFEAFLLRGGDP